MIKCIDCAAFSKCFASKLSAGQIEELEDCVNQTRMKKGEVLYTEKEQGKYYYMVLQGSLKAECNDLTGKSLIMGIVKEMQLTGLEIIGSREGVSPSRSHRTVLESLPSHGSSCSITNV